jgi:hypothetical protein
MIRGRSTPRRADVAPPPRPRRWLKRDRAAHRVAGDVRALQAELAEPARDSVDVGRDRRVHARRQRIGTPEPEQVAGDDVERVGERLDHRSPRRPVVADAVQQHERRPAVLAVEVDRHDAAIRSAARSAIITVGACVLPPTMVGMIEASATRNASSPWTRSRESTTASCAVSLMRQVPTGW